MPTCRVDADGLSKIQAANVDVSAVAALNFRFHYDGSGLEVDMKLGIIISQIVMTAFLSFILANANAQAVDIKKKATEVALKKISQFK